MHAFGNGLLPNTFNDYFTKIQFLHKHDTRLKTRQKYYLPRMTTSLGQRSLTYLGPKIWSEIPNELKSLSVYGFRKQYKKHLTKQASL